MRILLFVTVNYFALAADLAFRTGGNETAIKYDGKALTVPGYCRSSACSTLSRDIANVQQDLAALEARIGLNELSNTTYTLVGSAKHPSRWSSVPEGQRRVLGFYNEAVDSDNWSRDMSPLLETAALHGYKVDLKVHDCFDENLLTHETTYDARALLQVMTAGVLNFDKAESSTYNWIHPASRVLDGLATPGVRKIDVSIKATGVHPYNVNTAETVTAAGFGAGSAAAHAKEGNAIAANFFQFGQDAQRGCSLTASRQCWALWDGGGGSTHVRLGAHGLDFYMGICAPDDLHVGDDGWGHGGQKTCHDSLKNNGGAHQGLSSAGCLSQHPLLAIDSAVCQDCPASYTGSAAGPHYGCYNNNDAGRNACVSIKRAAP